MVIVTGISEFLPIGGDWLWRHNPLFDILVFAASLWINIDSDTDIPAVDIKEYRDTLGEDILLATMPLQYMFKIPMGVNTNHPRGTRSPGWAIVCQ